jgi:hypothetical protein
MNSFVTDFRMHGKKISKLGRHLVINNGKRALAIIEMIINQWRAARSLSMIMHVVHDDTGIHDLPHLSCRRDKSRVPNTSKTSFE